MHFFFRHIASAGEIAILMMQPLLNTDDAGKSKLFQIKSKIYRDLWTVDTPFKFRWVHPEHCNEELVGCCPLCEEDDKKVSAIQMNSVKHLIKMKNTQI